MSIPYGSLKMQKRQPEQEQMQVGYQPPSIVIVPGGLRVEQVNHSTVECAYCRRKRQRSQVECEGCGAHLTTDNDTKAFGVTVQEFSDNIRRAFVGTRTSHTPPVIRRSADMDQHR